MQPTDLCEYLAHNAYPGRGVLLGRSADGLRAVMAYFIMGRSENSRNRVFTPFEGGVRSEAADPSKVTDPRLILYTPVRVTDAFTTVVTNGDQTDTVAETLLAGGTFEQALRTRAFEPDGPHWTPRVSGVMTVRDGAMAYALSILKCGDGLGESVQRFFFEYPQPCAGEGHLLHTYAGPGDPLPSFAGEPVSVCLPVDDLDTFAASVWNALDLQNRVSLFVRAIDLADGHTDTRILNQRG